MEHIANFDGFLNEARIGKHELSTEELIDMLATEKGSRLDPKEVVNHLINKFWILAAAVTQNGPKDGFLVLANVDKALKEGKFRNDSKVEAAFDNLSAIFFDEFPKFTVDDSDLAVWGRGVLSQVSNTTKKNSIKENIAKAEKELATIQDSIKTMKVELASLEAQENVATKSDIESLMSLVNPYLDKDEMKKRKMSDQEVLRAVKVVLDKNKKLYNKVSDSDEWNAFTDKFFDTYKDLAVE
jgi:hypothetical protein